MRLEKVVTTPRQSAAAVGCACARGCCAARDAALIGNGNVLAIVIFNVAGLAIGHVLGGPNRDHSIVLALATACRHPAIALSLAAANFPDQRFGATILLYLIVSAIVSHCH